MNFNTIILTTINFVIMLYYTLLKVKVVTPQNLKATSCDQVC